MSSGATPERSGAGGGIRYNDRVVAFGYSGSGKSTLINSIAKKIRCQVLIFDSKDELIVPGSTPVYSASQIRWDERVIHLVDDSCQLDDVSRLFDACWRRKTPRELIGEDEYIPGYGLVVIVHELGDLCLDEPNRTPRSVINYIKKGRQRGLGLLAGSQRPVNIPKSARTEVQHVFTFAGGLDPDDLPVVAKMHRMSIPELERALQDANQAHGEHAYIWHNRRANTNVIRPALPEHLRNDTIARILEPHRSTGGNIGDQGDHEGGAPPSPRQAAESRA